MRQRNLKHGILLTSCTKYTHLICYYHSNCDTVVLLILWIAILKSASNTESQFPLQQKDCYLFYGMISNYFLILCMIATIYFIEVKTETSHWKHLCTSFRYLAIHITRNMQSVKQVICILYKQNKMNLCVYQAFIVIYSVYKPCIKNTTGLALIFVLVASVSGHWSITICFLWAWVHKKKKKTLAFAGPHWAVTILIGCNNHFYPKDWDIEHEQISSNLKHWILLPTICVQKGWQEWLIV